MTDKQTQQQAQHSNMEKDPGDWVTGDEPMTGAQRSYLKTLSEEAHVPFEDGLTKAQASRRIEELQAQTGRVSTDRQPSRPAARTRKVRWNRWAGRCRKPFWDRRPRASGLAGALAINPDFRAAHPPCSLPQAPAARSATAP